MLATYFEISGTGIKPLYTWDEVDGFGNQLFPILMWEAGEKIKSMLRFIRKVDTDDDDDEIEKNDLARAADMDREVINKTIDKMVGPDARGKKLTKDIDSTSYLRKMFTMIERFYIRFVSKKSMNEEKLIKSKRAVERVGTDTPKVVTNRPQDSGVRRATVIQQATVGPPPSRDVIFHTDL